MKKEKVLQNIESKGKILEGIVVSDKMKDTCTVAVKRYVKIPKYEKYINRTKKYLADDKGNTKKIGDKATIQECKPISKTKTFKVIA